MFNYEIIRGINLVIRVKYQGDFNNGNTDRSDSSTDIANDFPDDVAVKGSLDFQDFKPH